MAEGLARVENTCTVIVSRTGPHTNSVTLRLPCGSTAPGVPGGVVTMGPAAMQPIAACSEGGVTSATGIARWSRKAEALAALAAKAATSTAAATARRRAPGSRSAGSTSRTVATVSSRNGMPARISSRITMEKKIQPYRIWSAAAASALPSASPRSTIPRARNPLATIGMTMEATRNSARLW